MSGRDAWRVMKGTVEGYIADDAFSRGASIAYFTLFSMAPVSFGSHRGGRHGVRP